MSVLQNRRQAEAINGALAVLGLTAGLVLEGRTGNGILGQVHKLIMKRKPKELVLCLRMLQEIIILCTVEHSSYVVTITIR